VDLIQSILNSIGIKLHRKGIELLLEKERDIFVMVWSFWVETNLCRFLSFVYICIAVGYPVIKRGGL